MSDQSTTETARGALEKMTTQEILQYLHLRGYGAKRLSHALGGKIGYKSLHRWKQGQFKPRKKSDRGLLIDFACMLQEAGRTPPGLLPGLLHEEEDDNCPF